MDRNENIKCPSDGHNYRKIILLKKVHLYLGLAP